MTALVIIAGIILLAIAVVLAHRVRERRAARRHALAYANLGQREQVNVFMPGTSVPAGTLNKMQAECLEAIRPSQDGRASAGPVNVDADGREVA
jgi:hypothetical protein